MEDDRKKIVLYQNLDHPIIINTEEMPDNEILRIANYFDRWVDDMNH